MYSNEVVKVIDDFNRETRTTVYKDGRRVTRSTASKAPVRRKRGLSFTEISINETIREIDDDLSVLYRKMAALDVMMASRIMRGKTIEAEQREMGEYALQVLQLKNLRHKTLALLW